MVRMAHDAHEERSHPVDRADLVVRLSFERDFFAGNGGVWEIDGMLSEMDGFGVVRSAHFREVSR